MSVHHQNGIGSIQRSPLVCVKSLGNEAPLSMVPTKPSMSPPPQLSLPQSLHDDAISASMIQSGASLQHQGLSYTRSNETIHQARSLSEYNHLAGSIVSPRLENGASPIFSMLSGRSLVTSPAHRNKQTQYRQSGRMEASEADRSLITGTRLPGDLLSDGEVDDNDLEGEQLDSFEDDDDANLQFSFSLEPGH